MTASFRSASDWNFCVGYGTALASVDLSSETATMSFALKRGRRTLVLADDLRAWIERLPAIEGKLTGQTRNADEANFRCPSCQLEFWRSLDDARARLECEYCGHDFKAAPQLRDKGWAFRRSGLFGNYDHQEGAIPVLLTLQQLIENQSGDTIFSTAMTLKSKTAAISDCETDFVIITENEFDHRVQIAIGEAKTRKPITADDVAKLKAVADAFPRDLFKVYVVFARLSPFSDEEVEHIRQVNGPHDSRAIMLTDRELEPPFMYERTAKEFDISFNPISFEDMMIGTTIAFFEQRRCGAPAPVEQDPEP